MALLNSLFSGVSGLRNHQSMMDVIGNNIANVNTIGYKGSRVTFSDTFNQFVKSGTNPTATSGGTNSFQVGLGMKINSIDRNWNQGTFERTGITTDLALQGPGMFILKSNGQQFYSRAGAFIFDADGKLVDSQNGAVVQGKVANGLGEIPEGTTLQDIIIDKNLRLPAIKTTEAKWGGNLNSTSSTLKTDIIEEIGTLNNTGTGGGTEAGADFVQIYDKNGVNYQYKSWYTYNAGSSQWEMNYNLYDSGGTSILGAPVTTPLTFGADGKPTTSTIAVAGPVSDPDIAFDINLTALTSNVNSTSVTSRVDYGDDAGTVNGAVTIFDSLGNAHTLSITFKHIDSGKWSWDASISSTGEKLTNTPAPNGTIEFDANGKIKLITQGGAPIAGDFPSVNFQPTTGAESQDIQLNFGAGTTGITQTSLSSQVAALSQNGSASAALSNINIDQYGQIMGIFSNGNSSTLGQIMVATFNNLNGLVSVGDNLYTVAANSGDPRVDTPGENSVTTIQSGALEQSNVDLSEEFTKMIVAQRGFQANARVVTTADTLLQEITNLIR